MGCAILQARDDGGLAPDSAVEMVRGTWILDTLLEFLGLIVGLNVECKAERNQRCFEMRGLGEQVLQENLLVILRYMFRDRDPSLLFFT